MLQYEADFDLSLKSRTMLCLLEAGYQAPLSRCTGPGGAGIPRAYASRFCNNGKGSLELSMIELLCN